MLGFIAQFFINILWVGHVNTGNTYEPPLTDIEEAEYLKRLREGDEEAKQVLISRNLRLVSYIAKKYYGSTIENEDLLSIGTIGLVKAIRTYDCNKKTKLGTYAAACINNEILMQFRTIKKYQNDISLSDPLSNDSEGNEITLIDILEYEDSDIVEKIHQKSRKKCLLEAMRDKLCERECRILEMRFGLNGEKEMTQKDISKIFGISRSYVSRLEKKALNKLAQHLRELNVSSQ